MSLFNKRTDRLKGLVVIRLQVVTVRLKFGGLLWFKKNKNSSESKPIKQKQTNKKARTEKQDASRCSRVALRETDGPYSRPMTVFHHLSQSAAPSHWATTFLNKEQTNES